MDRIFKLCMAFKFLDFVIGSLLSATAQNLEQYANELKWIMIKEPFDI